LIDAAVETRNCYFGAAMSIASHLIERDGEKEKKMGKKIEEKEL
jgi:hypothetical protein